MQKCVPNFFNGFVLCFFSKKVGGVDRIVGICYNGTSEVKFAYTYNADGNITSHDDLSNGLEYQYLYDGSGKLTQTAVRKTGSNDGLYYLSKYEYDNQNRITDIEHYYCTGTDAASLSYTTYSYDAAGNICEVGFGATSKEIVYYRDSFGRLVQKSYRSDGSNETVYETQLYIYDTNGTLNGYDKTSMRVSCVVTEGAGSEEYVYYTYDAAGNVTEIHTIDDTGYSVSIYSYVYDDKGQLVRENISFPANSSKSKTVVYSYDTRGNILSKTTYPYTTGTLGTATSTYNYSYTNSQWGDLCTSEFEEFDAIGNPTSYGLAYLYWEGRQLTEYYDWEDDFSYTYAYNDAGVRISKNVNGVLHEYVVEGSQIQREVIYYSNSTNPQYDLRYYYDAEGNPKSIRAFTLSTTGTKTADNTYYLSTNIQGDVVSIYNANGLKIYTYAYDAWGNVISQGQYAPGGTLANSLNPFRYRGYYYDTETGWYYLNSRYYSPGMGRFINADSQLNGGLLGNNLFAYCKNSPVSHVDYSGLEDTEVGLMGNGIVDPDETLEGVGGSGNSKGNINQTNNAKASTAPGQSGSFGTGGGSSGTGYAPVGSKKRGDALPSPTPKGKNASGGSSVLKSAIDTYRNLRESCKGLGLQVHHIIEQRILKGWKMNTNSALSVALDPALHQQFTNEWRKPFAYGKTDYENLSKEWVWSEAQRIYQDYPELLQAAYETIYGSK